MAFLGQTFDATTVEPNGVSYPAAPAGKYLMQIIASEMKDTNSGGQMLALTLEIIQDGEFKGTRVYENLNLVNSSEKAVEIALSTLSAICRAIGEMQVSDSDQLHFKAFIGHVKYIPEGHTEKGGYVHKRAKNEMGGYEMSTGSQLVAGVARQAPASPAPAPATRPATPPAPPAPATAAPRSAPWGRRA